MKKIVAFLIAAVIVGYAAVAATGWALDQLGAEVQLGVNIQQPIQFNHNIHIEEADMDCIDCHRYFETQRNSGRPTTADCLDCHDDEDEEKEELLKILQYAKDKTDIPWKRIYYMPDHVLFSHQIHTQVAEIDSEKCHGNMAEHTVPQSRPAVLHSMEFCRDCHRENDASDDCLACHR